MLFVPFRNDGKAHLHRPSGENRFIESLNFKCCYAFTDALARSENRIAKQFVAFPAKESGFAPIAIVDDFEIDLKSSTSVCVCVCSSCGGQLLHWNQFETNRNVHQSCSIRKLTRNTSNCRPVNVTLAETGFAPRIILLLKRNK